MKTVITYNGKTFTELNNKNPRMITTFCKCGNRLNVPIAVIVLGIVEDCAHCDKDYPAVAHSAEVTDSYLGLIANEKFVSLD